MNFSDKADKKEENVKELGELKIETVNNADGTDGTKEKRGYIFQYFIQMYISLLT